MAQMIASNPTTGVDTQYDVELRKVFKVYNGETAVRGIDLGIRQGEFFSILGPSGCGKTTTLRLIAGFEAPTAGDVLIRGQAMGDVPPYRRPVNTVFQSYALFSHMTVWENIAFGLRIKKHGKAEIQKRVDEALQLVKMDAFARRYPSQLSGGQQQRVALARALVNRPAVVLLDEPLGALDLKLRKEMQVELSTLHQELGVTFVMVTHDQEEALSLSNRIAVMNGGRIEQIGTPSQIYENPQTPFVADFIGDTNLFQGFVEAADATLLKITTESGRQILVCPHEDWNGTVGDAVVVSVRPEKIHLSPEPPGHRANCFVGKIHNIMYLGTHVHYVIDLESHQTRQDGTVDRMTVLQPNRQSNLLALGAPAYVYWHDSDCLALMNTSTPT